MSKNLGRSAEEAIKAFKRWHAKEPRDIIETEYPFEKYDVTRIGYGDNILYMSDKWEDDNNFYDYIHDFDSAPSVYCDDPRVDGDGVDLCEMLALPEVSARATASWPVLGGVRELVVTRDDGSKRVFRFKSPPKMLGTLDNKCLVIPTQSHGPIYIRGGKMVITARGIHH